MKRIESFCDAVASYHDYWSPESQSYELRNPGMISSESQKPHTPEGKRIFSCHRAGYAALMDVVQKRCASHPQQNIKALLEYFGIKMPLQQEHAIDFISRCANSNAISLKTSLSWFLEE